MKGTSAKLVAVWMALALLVSCQTPSPTPEPTTVPPTTATPASVRPTTALPTRPPPTSIPTPTPAAPVPAKKKVLDRSGITLLFVPSGEFVMGTTDAEIDPVWYDLCLPYKSNCPHLWFEDEEPKHTVALRDYWIGQTEVTNAQYRRFVEAGGYDNQRYWSESGWAWKERTGITAPLYWTDSNWNGDDYPVVGVSWYEAEAFANWAGARLPTEEEWEKAARGTEGLTHPWGNTWDSTRLNYCDRNCPYSWKDSEGDDGYAFTAPVGSYPSGASPYGALDMAGNVWEWVDAWYKGYPGTERQSVAFGETYRVLRGGCWFDEPASGRGARRYAVDPEMRVEAIGFRLAQ